MATLYLDPVGGNDASDGLSFANRKKTIASIGGRAAGDVVRIIESRPPYALGNGTWTDNSRTVTLATGKTIEVDPGTAAWTASANVTSTANTSRKFGATASRFAVASGFTTGKVAYKVPAAGTLDLSGYEGISFWLNTVTVGSLTLNGILTLRLCSDAVGDVVVNTISINLNQAITANLGSWVPIFVDTGAALGAAIASISLSFSSDPGTCTFQVNNIVACKSSTHADHISHACMIGKMTGGEPEWYPVDTISDTALTVASTQHTEAIPGRVYRGVTETVTTYALLPTFQDMSTAQRTVAAGNGTEASSVLWSGGWDSTAMSTQSGETWWDGRNFLPGAWGLASRAWHSQENLGYCRYSDKLWVHNSGGPFEFDVLGVVGNTAVTDLVHASSPSGAGIAARVGSMVMNEVGLRVYSLSGVDLIVDRITGCTAQGAFVGSALSIGYNQKDRSNVEIKRIDNNGSYGISGSGPNGAAWVRGCLFENNATSDVDASMGGLYLDNCTFNSTTQVSGTVNTEDSLTITAEDGDPTLHKIFKAGWNALTQSAVRHTASGVAWQIRPTSASFVSRLQPATLSLAKVAVAASALVTLKCWVRRDSTSLTIGIRLRGRQIPGMGDTQVVLTAAAIDTWDELTITFTPTSAGVVELEGIAYGGTTFNGYFDDVGASQ